MKKKKNKNLELERSFYMSKESRKTKYPAKQLHYRVAIALRETTWLESAIRWQNNQLTWQGFVPSKAAIHRTQLHLVKASKRLRDTTWLDQRNFNLQIVYRLQNLTAQPRSAAALTEWLLAEAVCLDLLPFPVAEKLVTLHAEAIEPLQQFIATPAWFEAHALAALVLGAISARQSDFRLGQPLPANLKPYFNWGKQHGVPADPAFYVRLLADPQGADLAQRYQAATATQHRNHFQPSQEILHSFLLGKTATPLQLVTLAEAGRPFPALLETIRAKLVSKVPFAYYYGRRFQEQNEAFLQEFASFQKEFESFVFFLSRKSRDGYLLKLVLLHVQAMLNVLDSLDYAGDWGKCLLQTFQNSLKLEPELARSYLELLIEQHSFFWKPTSLQANPTCAQINVWYNNALADVERMYTLLQDGQNPALVREIITLDILTPASARRYQHPEQLKELLWFVRQLNLQNNPYLINQLGKRFCKASPEVLKKGWRPFGEIILRLPVEKDNVARTTVLDDLLDNLHETNTEVRDRLTSFGRHSAAWLAFMRRYSCVTDAPSEVIALLPDIDRSQPDSGVWLEALLAEVEAADRVQRVANDQAIAKNGNTDDAENVFYAWLLREVNLLALALSGDDLATYRAILKTGFRHGLDGEQELIQAACPLLKKLPTIKAPLIRALGHSYQECLKVIVKFGEVSSLQSARLTPLGALGASFAVENFPPAWAELVGRYPELTPVCASYLHSRWLSDLPLEIPAGVQHELNLTSKMENEIAFLEQAVLAKPTLQKRLENLRLRLAATEKLDQQIRQDAGQKLLFMSDLAFLHAARAQIKKCYQVELAVLAPPANPALTVDENLLNALQIFSGIHKNRPMLLRLLRMRARGETDWRANLPANRQFIADFSEQGKNAEVWLAENRQTFSLSQQQIQLYLENDPFHVLQMGNYFGTCLSATGFNAFSTITNACDFNKRVIYARDEKGKVIARKLIAVTKKWELVGFQTYVGLENEKLNNALRRIFNQYCRELAARCNLELNNSDCCEVAKLVTTDWYDDGAVEWYDPAPENKEKTTKNPTSKTPGSPPTTPGVLNSSGTETVAIS